MQKPCYPNFPHISGTKAQVLGHPTGHKHGSQGMLEPGMVGAGINRFY
jgi:hypothetical protein